MTVTLPPSMDHALELRARAAGFGSPEEFVRDALIRMLTEDSHHEAAVLEGLRGDVAPLSEADRVGVRQLGTTRCPPEPSSCDSA